MIAWLEQLAWMEVVASRFPHVAGEPIVMWRRDKRGRGRLRPALTLAMCVAARTAVGMGEHALVERDGRRRLKPHQVYAMRVRVLRFERDEALAAEYGVSQSSATRAIDGDTYRDVPFPISVTHPDVPTEVYYPYRNAIAVLAAVSIDQPFTIKIQPHTPRLRVSGMLRLMDQVLGAPPPRQPHPPATPTPPTPSNSHHRSPTHSRRFAGLTA